MRKHEFIFFYEMEMVESLKCFSFLSPSAIKPEAPVKVGKEPQENSLKTNKNVVKNSAIIKWRCFNHSDGNLLFFLLLVIVYAMNSQRNKFPFLFWEVAKEGNEDI